MVSDVAGFSLNEQGQRVLILIVMEHGLRLEQNNTNL